MGGEQGAEGLTVVTGIHDREEVGGGFVMGAGLFGDPVHAQMRAQKAGKIFNFLKTNVSYCRSM